MIEKFFTCTGRVMGSNIDAVNTTISPFDLFGGLMIIGGLRMS